ncbi:hypothetical protein FHX15_004709 [Rhizobium sp. BK650]|nr:hypothetical protein [Rhizobium sp. BK650]
MFRLVFDGPDVVPDSVTDRDYTGQTTVVLHSEMASFLFIHDVHQAVDARRSATGEDVLPHNFGELQIHTRDTALSYGRDYVPLGEYTLDPILAVNDHHCADVVRVKQTASVFYSIGASRGYDVAPLIHQNRLYRHLAILP